MGGKFDKYLGKFREKDEGSGGSVNSVNGFAPDDSGNVEIGFPASGYVANMHGQSAWCDLKTFLEYLSYGVYSVNGEFYPDESGNVNIYASNLPMRGSSSEDPYPPTVYDAFSTTDDYKMGSPIYNSYGVQSCEPNTDYQTDSTGYILLELGVRDGEVPTVPFLVTINEITVAAIVPAAGTRQTFMFPCPAWVTWRCDNPGLPFEIVSIQFVQGEHIMH